MIREGTTKQPEIGMVWVSRNIFREINKVIGKRLQGIEGADAI